MSLSPAHRDRSDRNLYSLDTIERAIEYIEWNPVRRGYIEEPVQWKWSSANARTGDFDVPIQVDEVRWEETNTC